MPSLLQIAVAILVFWLISAFLIPLLPAPLGTVAWVILILAVIFWLINNFIPTLGA